jgi:hypothetical protein
MSIPAFASEPPKLAIFNVATAERIDAQFNPQEFQFQLAVNYSDLSVPGAGYEPEQYTNTSNGTMPINLFYNSYTEEEKQQRDAAERFLLALCYPRRGAGVVRQHPPPRAMIVWPRYARLVCTVRTLNISVARFNVRMEPVEETFQITVKTSQDAQLFSEDIARQGLRRPSPRGVGTSGEVPSVDGRSLPQSPGSR